MKINNVRYKLYEEYLINNIDKYNIILSVDVRDTIFQKDIFKLYEKKKKPFIGVSLEMNNLAHNSINTIWTKSQYGGKVYEIIKNETIICSGAFIGTADKFVELVRNLWEQIKLKLPYKYYVHDQTALNYIIYYKNKFNDCLIKNYYNYGPLMSIGKAKHKNYTFDSEGNILTDNGEIAALIHQYDRIPKLAEIIKNRFNQSNINISYFNSNKSSEIKMNNIKFYILIIFVIINIIISLTLISKIVIAEHGSRKKVEAKNSLFTKIKSRKIVNLLCNKEN